MTLRRLPVAIALIACGGLSYFSWAPTTNSVELSWACGWGMQLAVGSPIDQQAANTTNPIPVFRDASVYYPSVIKVGNTFYVFGSHLAAAKTKDSDAVGHDRGCVNPDNPLFDNVVDGLKETFDWAQATTLWAADVIQLKDGRFYMYYNACKGDSPRSALGVAVADKVDGPYKIWAFCSSRGCGASRARMVPSTTPGLPQRGRSGCLLYRSRRASCGCLRLLFRRPVYPEAGCDDREAAT